MSQEVQAVRVVSRVRPFIRDEVKSEKEACKSLDEKTVSVYIDKISRIKQKGSDPRAWRQFTYDRVYGPEESQKTVFEGSVRGILDNFLDGFNTTIFAYGQTSSGKTHTMMGDLKNEVNAGLTPRAVRHVFDTIKSRANSSSKFLVTLSYLEIYNEKVNDLLVKTSKRLLPADVAKGQGLKIRQSPNGGFYVPDLSTHLVTSEAQIHKLIQQGQLARATAATTQNITSSRSHSILILNVEKGTTIGGHMSVRTSKLNMVDLAGSERFQGGSIARQKESASINKSLNMLGNVISALTKTGGKGKSKKKFIGYRDSALTMLLMDSLGGNACTLMIANVNPCGRNVAETVSTLRYASRAKKIKNVARKNLNPKDAILLKLQQEIESLRQAVEAKDKIIESMGGAAVGDTGDDAEGKISDARDDRQKIRERLASVMDVVITGGGAPSPTARSPTVRTPKSASSLPSVTEGAPAEGAGSPTAAARPNSGAGAPPRVPSRARRKSFVPSALLQRTKDPQVLDDLLPGWQDEVYAELVETQERLKKLEEESKRKLDLAAVTSSIREAGAKREAKRALDEAAAVRSRNEELKRETEGAKEAARRALEEAEKREAALQNEAAHAHAVAKAKETEAEAIRVRAEKKVEEAAAQMRALQAEAERRANEKEAELEAAARARLEEAQGALDAAKARESTVREEATRAQEELKQKLATQEAELDRVRQANDKAVRAAREAAEREAAARLKEREAAVRAEAAERAAREVEAEKQRAAERVQEEKKRAAQKVKEEKERAAQKVQQEKKRAAKQVAREKKRVQEAAKAREGKIRKEAVAVAAAGVKQMQTVMDLQSSQLASTKLSKANFLRTGVNQRASGVSGWLHKRGKLNTAFKRRFCKLRAENVDGREQLCLSYYKNKTDRKPRGEVIIGPKTPIKPSLMSPLEFTIATPDREFVFLAESRESFELWFFACNAFGLGEVEEPQEEDGKEDDGSADASNAAIDISRDR